MNCLYKPEPVCGMNLYKPEQVCEVNLYKPEPVCRDGVAEEVLLQPGGE